MKSPIIYFADTPNNTAEKNNLHWTFSEEDDYEEYLSVTVLGFLEAIYEPIDVHTHYEKINKSVDTFDSLNIVPPFQLQDQDNFENKILAIEQGRRIAKGTLSIIKFGSSSCYN